MTNKINMLKRKLYRRNKGYEDIEVNLHSYVFNKALGRISRKKIKRPSREIKFYDLCKSLGAEIPSHIDNINVTNIAANFRNLEEGGVLVLFDRDISKYQLNLEKAFKRGAVAVFVDKDTFVESGAKIGNTPVIEVKDGTKHFVDFFNGFRRKFDGKVVCITGSVGKTTTKEYIQGVLSKENETFISVASRNAYYQIVDNLMYKLNNDKDIYVQEVGAMNIGIIDRVSRILRPDISVITNILPHHLAAYETFENLMNDKVSLAENVNDGGVAVVNFDDKNLREYKFSSPIVSFGINTEDNVDYRAVNVKQEKSRLTMDIMHDGRSTHVESYVLGEFNAYNILAAFAVGQLSGISEENIIKGIAEYSSGGIRQNVMEYGSNTFMVDCFNVCNETIINAVGILEDQEVPVGSRKIAVVGGENTLGDFRIEKTKELGLALSKFDIDEFICFGTSETTEKALNLYGDAATLHDTLKECNVKKCTLVTSFDDLVDYLRANIKPGDAVLFKSIIYLHLPVVIDKAFGTNISLRHNYMLDKAKTKTVKGYTGMIYPYMDEVLLSEVSQKILSSTKVSIPKIFAGKRIFGIDKGLFAYSGIKEIDLGTDVRIICTGAFKGCDKLETVVVPDSVMHMMEGVFKNCKNLSSVKIGKGIRQIDEGVFEGCHNLRTVELPAKSGLQIAPKAIPAHVSVRYYDI